MSVLDELGLVKENNYLVIHFIAENKILPLRVVRRNNRGFERFEYGPIPVTFEGYSQGVIPARQYTPEFTFSYNRLLPEDAPDMWYFTDKNKVYHVYVTIEPAYLLRVMRRIPQGTSPYSFRTISASASQILELEFGFTRGKRIEQVFLPNLKIGWVVGNPTNIDLKTYVTFIYGDYDVEFVRDAETIWNLMIKKKPAHWFTMGGTVTVPSGTMENILKALDATLISMLPAHMSPDEAIANIRTELGGE